MSQEPAAPPPAASSSSLEGIPPHLPSPKSERVDLLTLAASALASSISASRPIRNLSTRCSSPRRSSIPIRRGQKNARLKVDGTVITDADGAAQRIIVGALRGISEGIRIVGEESRREMERLSPVPSSSGASAVSGDNNSGEEEEKEELVEGALARGGGADSEEAGNSEQAGEIFETVKEEIIMRLKKSGGKDDGERVDTATSAIEADASREQKEVLKPQQESQVSEKAATEEAGGSDTKALAEKTIPTSEYQVDASRVSVFVDPLDGTKSYAQGDYDAVTTLVGIILDNSPCFGVICKPFGHGRDNVTVLNSGCYAVYGGTLLGGVYVAGGDECEISIRHKEKMTSIKNDKDTNDDKTAQEKSVEVDNTDTLAAERSHTKKEEGNGNGAVQPRAVISRSRSGGIVRKCIDAMSDAGLLHQDPIHISGAGQKTLQLIVGSEGESLWFFPKPGTSLWDVAAADALLRVIGGRLSDKYGRDLDYSKSRKDAVNVDGVVACNDAALHAECIKLFSEGKWEEDGS